MKATGLGLGNDRWNLVCVTLHSNTDTHPPFWELSCFGKYVVLHHLFQFSENDYDSFTWIWIGCQGLWRYWFLSGPPRLKTMISWDNKKFASNNLLYSAHLKKITTKVKLQALQYKGTLKKIMTALIFRLSVLSGSKTIWILHLPSCNHLNNFRSYSKSFLAS